MRICRMCAGWLACGLVVVTGLANACGPGWTAGPCLRYSDCATGYTCADGLCQPLPEPLPEGGNEAGDAASAPVGNDASKSTDSAATKDTGHDGSDAKVASHDSSAG